MKIIKVKWLDHPILGNLELDFTNAAGQPFDTIVFAGENGSGKTTILESINTFLNQGSVKHFEYIKYQSAGKTLKAIPASGVNNDVFFDVLDGEETLKVHTAKNIKNAV